MRTRVCVHIHTNLTLTLEGTYLVGKLSGVYSPFQYRLTTEARSELCAIGNVTATKIDSANRATTFSSV